MEVTMEATSGLEKSRCQTQGMLSQREVDNHMQSARLEKVIWGKM